MRVCLIATELAGHSKSYGGFGMLTRDIAKGLVDRGLEVYVVVCRQPGQKPIVVDEGGFTVISCPLPLYTGITRVRRFKSIFELIDADIYHSEEPSVGTSLAIEAMPHRRHIITFQDPRTIEDRKIDWGIYSKKISKNDVIKFIISYYFSVKKYVKKADALFCQAKYIIPKVMKIYNLHKTPGFLPNPVKIPTERIIKNSNPTVCFIGRWDIRKNPELFFELAKRFPDVKFIAAGACRTDLKRDKMLREKHKNIPNLVMPGWVDNTEKSKILEKSWIMINTSYRECLPVSYIEAVSYQCAILSYENPDNFPDNFGYRAKKVDIEEYSKGLKFLLENNRWKNLGMRGYEYVKSTFEYDKVIDKHIKIYEEVMKLPRKQSIARIIWNYLPESGVKNAIRNFYYAVRY